MKKMIGALTVLLAVQVNAESAFRASGYEPNVLQREGLALLRVVCSPLSFFTEGAQSYNEHSEATGSANPFSFIGGFVVCGPFVTCFEAVGGVCELVSFQQFKSCAYPWEVDANDQKMVKYIREREKEERLASETTPKSDFVGELIGAAAGAAAGAAVESAFGHHGGGTVQVISCGGSSGGHSSGSRKIRHSSCNGTGFCNVCHGKGYLGLDPKNTRLKCRSCGGSGRCCACNGGYVYRN